MTRYLLDTDIIRNATKPVPSEPLVTWMADQADEQLFLAAFTLAEIQRGILETPKGRKRQQLENWFSGPEGLRMLFAGRVLPFDEAAALIWARLMSEGLSKGRPPSPLYMIIAAIAEANGSVLVTDNEKHFAGLNVLNPLRDRH